MRKNASSLRVLFGDLLNHAKNLRLIYKGLNDALNIGLLGWKYKRPFDLMAFCSKIANWQGLKDDYRTYCGIVSFSKGSKNDA